MRIKTIDFDQVALAKNIYEHGFSKKSSDKYKEIGLLAKYIKLINPKFGQILLKAELQRIIHKYDPDFNFIICRKMIKKSVRLALRYKLAKCLPINITAGEMNSILKFEDRKHQKIAFCMLVLAKTLATRDFGIAKKERSNKNLYLDTRLQTFIKRLAGVQMIKDEFRQYIKIAHSLGLISFYLERKGEFTAYVIYFADDESEKLFEVSDFENMIKSFPIEDEPLRCEKCGRVIKKAKKNGQLICTWCYTEQRKADVRVNVARSRAAKKAKEIELFGTKQ